VAAVTAADAPPPAPPGREASRAAETTARRQASRAAGKVFGAGAGPQWYPELDPLDTLFLGAVWPGEFRDGLRALSGSRFFAAIGERALLGDLRQVRDYLHVPEIRRQAVALVAGAVEDDTRVLVGHSLGSVVAYEALCAHPEWPVRGLVTLGAPLGIPNLIFDRLQPAPLSRAEAGSGPRGRWPGKGRA
jgi:pimeloyl-ACP methyl ester carboxylesterase